MVKLISFPKDDYNIYLQALNNYNNSNYEDALVLMNQLQSLDHFKKLIIKLIIECNINLQRFNSVYELIEEEFLEDNVSEDYLIEKYIYTMLLEKKYNEANKLIDLIFNSHHLTNHLQSSLSKLKMLSLELQEKEALFNKISHNEFKKQNDIINLIIDLDHCNYEENKALIHSVLKDAKVDPLVKYQILKQLVELNVNKKVEYINNINEQYIIDLNTFIDIYEDENYLTPPIMVYDTICQCQTDFIIDLELIKNIWLNDYLLVYPKQYDSFNNLAYLLHIKIMHLFGENFNNDELKQVYQIDNKYVYNNFNVKYFTNYQFML